MSSTHTPSTDRKRIEPWDQILLRIVQVQGGDILSKIVQSKVSAHQVPRSEFTPTQIVQVLTELRQPRQLAARVGTSARQRMGVAREKISVLKQNWKQLRHGPHRKEPLQKAALQALSFSGFLGGVLFGLQLPQLDLKLSAKGKERESLVVHAAALVATEIAAEWMQEVLRRTLLTPSLSTNEARFLRALNRVLHSSLAGVERGWSARQVVSTWVRFWRSPIAKQHLIATDARAVKLAQEMIERLRKGRGPT